MKAAQYETRKDIEECNVSKNYKQPLHNGHDSDTKDFVKTNVEIIL